MAKAKAKVRNITSPHGDVVEHLKGEISSESVNVRWAEDLLSDKHCFLCRKKFLLRDKKIKLSSSCEHEVHDRCARTYEIKDDEICRVYNCEEPLSYSVEYIKILEQRKMKAQASIQGSPVNNSSEREYLSSNSGVAYEAAQPEVGVAHGLLRPTENVDDEVSLQEPGDDNYDMLQSSGDHQEESVIPQSMKVPDFMAPEGPRVDSFEDDDISIFRSSMNAHDLIEGLEAPLGSNLGPLAMGDEAAILRDQDVQPESLTGLTEGEELVFDSAEEKTPQDTKVVVERRRPSLRPPARPLPAPSPTTFVATDLDDEDTVEL